MHGEIEEGAVIYDKATGKSRGYGFITYKHMESAQSALGAPSRLIDVSWFFLSSCMCDISIHQTDATNSVPFISLYIIICVFFSVHTPVLPAWMICL